MEATAVATNKTDVAPGDNYNTEDNTQLIPGRPAGVTSGSSVESPSEFIPLQMEDEKKAGRCNPGGLRVIIISAVSFSVVVTVALIITIYFGPSQVLLHQAVASDSPQCSQVGTQTIQAGGSSVDAAIATTICMGVVLPTQSGLGGAGYMIIRNNAKKTTTVIDFMATAPAAASETMFDGDPQHATKGAQSVAVPGLLKGLKEAHELYGTLSWHAIVAPCIKLARDGFNVSQQLAADLLGLDPVQYPSMVDVFSVNGQWLQQGDLLQQPDLAELLDNIAINGADPLYTGTVAEEIINQAGEAAGGLLTLDDLSSYSIQKPVAATVQFMGQTVESIPAPSGGPVVLSSLSILNNFGWTNMSDKDLVSYHRIVEALKHAYGQRGYLGDPYFDDAVMTNVETYMLNVSHSAMLAAQINGSNATLQDSEYGIGLDQLTFPEGDSGTTVAVFGKAEEMIAVTTTLGRKLGSGIRTPSGVILNSLMGFFTVPAAQGMNTANNIGPGKRPVTPLAPTVTYSTDKPCNRRMALGSRGNLNAYSGVTEVLVNVVGFRKSLENAITAKRFCDVVDGTGLHYEPGLSDDVVNYLESMGHQMNSEWSVNIINAVAKINETVEAEADPRGSGAIDIV